MNEYKFIPTPVFRDPILRYWIFLKGKILPIGYLVEDIGGVDVIPPGRILHILVGRLDEAVRRNGEAVRAFQNHFPVMPGPRFRQRVGIRLAHGEAYAKEVAVRFFQAGHDFQRFLENDPGGRLGFRSADVA